ncbi:hypothetical protein B0H15DRAFT_955154 [Mycena belliarum]|uniref:Uncharacterized protein n=1 Tax=Mycena belliarum TaxID=1033014 RepID=A0AAD6TX09_9AGAR|nr:hypothetical protein B0H15DRAFT_958632 [Mycena belliae]KAJ7077277.1 hypothetical protein B0H15DRAFT_955151 [Mycena belliae]KAJ7077280.1 hypothetical protein B0H15DRAFT_955154 [Mycena belliae]
MRREDLWRARHLRQCQLLALASLPPRHSDPERGYPAIKRAPPPRHLPTCRCRAAVRLGFPRSRHRVDAPAADSRLGTRRHRANSQFITNIMRATSPHFPPGF